MRATAWRLAPLASLAQWRLEEQRRTVAGCVASLAGHEQVLARLQGEHDDCACARYQGAGLDGVLRRRLLHLAALQGDIAAARQRRCAAEAAVVTAREACAQADARLQGLRRLQRAGEADAARLALRRQQQEADGLWLARRRWADALEGAQP